MMFCQKRMSIALAVLLLTPTTCVIAFMSQHAFATRRSTVKIMSMEPSHITSSVDQILNHPTLEALLSTVYSTAVQLQPAHGHEMTLFGPVDPYLLKMQSIVPAPNAGVDLGAPVFEEASIPDALRGAIDYARRGDFVDPTHVLRVDGAAPGFVTPRTFFPPLQTVPQTQDYQLGVLNAEVGNLRKLQNIPIAAFLTVLVDFFLVTPGMEVFKEEIDENGEQVTRESAIAGTARVAVLAVVAGLTLAFSG
ncbi:hypothetical protein MHU86_19725 [Fragilaria crotonensis]|nr:hypothetical protein MHU86_19725 [Fragilaria crotonensis]